MLNFDVRERFGGAAAAAAAVPGAPTATTVFTAFVASSTQHDELDPASAVDGPKLCADLERQGFTGGCHLSLEPYDPKPFAELTRSLDFQSVNGIYPFRSVASATKLS